MRDTAPHVLHWVVRMWSARSTEYSATASSASGGAPRSLLSHVPEDWGPILQDIGDSYMPYLRANEKASKDRKPFFDFDIQGYHYHLPVNHYRHWCLEKLQQQYLSLPEKEKEIANAILKKHGIYNNLIAPVAPSAFDPQNKLPFLTPNSAWDPSLLNFRRGVNVHDGLAKG